MKKPIDKSEGVVREELEGIAHALLPIAGKSDNDWAYLWVPVAGPIVGATIAGFVGVAIFKTNHKG